MVPPLNPFPVHCPLVNATDIANRTNTTTSETTVTPKKQRVNGPFALNSFTMAIALAGERAVIMAPTSIAIPVIQPEERPRSLVNVATPALINKRTPAVTSPNVRIEIAPTDKNMLLNKSRNSGRYSSADKMIINNSKQ
jgi:hypothetical protein